MYYIYKVKPICQCEEYECYYGKTKNTLSHRFTGHKNRYGDYKNKNKKMTSIYKLFAKYGKENLVIELVEEVEDEKTAEEKERYYIMNFSCINIKKPGFGSLYHRVYYYQNRERLLEYGKQYRKAISSF